MSERPPTPISHGIEIQKVKNEALQKWSMEQYRKLVEFEKTVEDQLDAALSSVPTQENMAEIEELFEKKKVLDKVGDDLDEMILGTYKRQDELNEKMIAFEERLHLHGIE
jgi:hypothetical protein